MRRRSLPLLLLVLAACYDYDVSPVAPWDRPENIPTPINFEVVPEPAGGAAVLARWNAPFDIWVDPDSIFTVIDGFLLERTFADEDSFRWEPVLPALTQEQRVTDRDVEAGRIYAYRVSSVTPAGIRSVPTDPAYIQVLDLPPAGPEAVRALVQSTPEGDPFVTVFWDPPIAAEGVDGYLVSREPGLPATSVADTVYVDPTVAWGNEYLYRVQAVIDGRESDPVTVSVPVFPVVPNFRGVLHEDPDGTWGVVLGWDAPPDVVISHYHLYRIPRWPDGSEYRTWIARAYEDVEVEPYLTYRYRVEGVDYLDRRTPSTGFLEFVIPGS